MAEYKLQPNEAIILKSKSVSQGFWGAYTDEILLTNLNFIWTKIGIMGFPKTPHIYPLSQIKTFEGKVQVFKGEHSGNGSPMLDVYINDGTVKQFGFQISTKAANSEIQKWLQAFNKTIIGEDYDDDEDEENIRDDSVVGAFKEVGSQLKEAFFGVKTENKPKVVKEKVATKCISCGAPLPIGIKGKVVR
jgi:hypothetical protein